MSLFGAMSTAISGLSAQSAAFGNISDNVANSQTVGYKRTDTSFESFLTTSNASVNDSGAVVARPDYVNSVQGTITQTDNPLAMAIAGDGFFPVSQATDNTSGLPNFDPRNFYTRSGDFSMDRNGYLVNTSGYFLNGWTVNSTTGIVNQNQLQPVQVNQTVYNPVPTSQMTLAANLPATPATGATLSSQVNVYDAVGQVHTVTLNWAQNASNDWTVTVNSPDDTVSALRGTAQVMFGAASGNGVTEGTIGSLGAATGSVIGSTFAANTGATLDFTTDFGSGPQSIQIDIGTFGQANGVTQYAGTDYSLRGITQNGVAPGAFSGITTRQNGDVVVNYDNGQSRTVARVPIVTFNSPDSLQRQDGGAFTVTQASGLAMAQNAASNGAGSLVVSSIEKSNVDIANEFSKLIVAQRAYSANTKMVTTADEFLQQTIDMKR